MVLRSVSAISSGRLDRSQGSQSSFHGNSKLCVPRGNGSCSGWEVWSEGGFGLQATASLCRECVFPFPEYACFDSCTWPDIADEKVANYYVFHSVWRWMWKTPEVRAHQMARKLRSAGFAPQKIRAELSSNGYTLKLRGAWWLLHHVGRLRRASFLHAILLFFFFMALGVLSPVYSWLRFFVLAYGRQFNLF